MEPIRIEDLMTYAFLSAPEYAPDGKKAAFVVSRCDGEENGCTSCLWLYREGALRQLTSLGKESAFTWWGSGRLLFAADRTENEKKRRENGEVFTAFYALPLDGGEAVKAFEVPLDCRELVCLDETHFAAFCPIDPAHPDAFADPEERKFLAERKKKDRDYHVLEEVPYYFNGSGFTDRRRNALFLVTLDPEPHCRRITGPWERVGAHCVLGDEVILDIDPNRTVMRVKGCRLEAVRWRTGERRLITAREDLTVDTLFPVENALWLAGTDCRRYGMNENPWFYSLDTENGSLSLIRAEEYGLHNSVGSDCRYGGGKDFGVWKGALYYLTTREGNGCVYRLGADGQSTPVLTAPGSADALAISPACPTALVTGLFGGLQELYTLDLSDGTLTQVSHFNDAALKDKAVSVPEPLSCVSGGTLINGFVLKPAGYDPEKTWPGILEIHGGPKCAFGSAFFHEMQVLASRGYFVFYCNPRGSDGRDNAFSDIFGAYGENDYHNLMDFTDAVLKAWPQIDPKRLGVAGGSYGGFMTNWIIGHTDRFAAAASQRSISNWLSFWGTSDIGFFFAPDQIRGDLYASPEKLWAHSPLKYAHRVRTPTLFIHSDEDWRCPLEQGLQMVTALLSRNVPARLCLFHGENHELSRSGKPLHRLRRLEEICAWFDRYLSGKGETEE